MEGFPRYGHIHFRVRGSDIGQVRYDMKISPMFNRYSVYKVAYSTLRCSDPGIAISCLQTMQTLR